MISRVKTYVVLIALLLSTSMLPADKKEGEHQEKSIRPYHLNRDEKITLDGVLDDGAWRLSSPSGDFRQNEPNLGQPASFPTLIHIAYDSDFIYFGIFCSDPEPGKITAGENKREGLLTNDDSIAIYLDTFNDDVSAYSFSVNSKGVQSDGRIMGNGQTYDQTWDGQWRATGKVSTDGWTLEIAIPFSTLTYPPGRDKIWGIGVSRYIPRLLEIDTWSGTMDYSRRVSLFGQITDLNLEKPRLPVEIIPHIITRLEEKQETELEAGLSAHIGLSGAITANIAINPDFATVEADPEQINLTRFELNLAEKRHFFQEGAEHYQQRIRLFYSRRIHDIHGGLKIFGKTAGFDFEIIDAFSKKSQYPVAEESANYSILRLSRKIFTSSWINLLSANKILNGKFHGATGMELIHFFSDRFQVTGQLAASYGQFSQRNIAYFIRPSYDDSTFHLHLRYTRLEENFGDNTNKVGFIPDDNRDELDSSLKKVWWLKNPVLERIKYSSNYNIYWGAHNGRLRSWEIIQSVRLDFTNRLSLQMDYNRSFRRYEKDFDNYSLGAQLGYNQREWQSVGLTLESGRNFGQNFLLLGGTANIQLRAETTLEYTLKKLRLTPDPELEGTWIHGIRFNHYFSREFFIRIFYQNRTISGREDIQALLVYRFYPPFGAVQLAYQRSKGHPYSGPRSGDSLFLKVSYVL